MEDGLGDDIIWEIWGRRQQGRTKYGRYGEEENRGRAGDMGKKRTGEDRIWEIWGRGEQGRTEYGMYGEEENRRGQNMGDMGKKSTGTE
jgi:hypothetical protein